MLKKLAANGTKDSYPERIDRNIGWITKFEQKKLAKSIVGIAGCGGMGGHLAEQLLRLGVGEIRIADNEDFSVSNINRQYAATAKTIGKSKAKETARKLREIADDTKIIVFPAGVGEKNMVDFIQGCDLVCDEIEFWAVGSRILLHQKARELNVAVFNGNAIGFGCRLFLFTPDSLTMEEVLGLDLKNAVSIQKGIEEKTVTQTEIDRVMNSVIKGLAPEIPQYYRKKHKLDPIGRMSKESKASVLGAAVAMATGFVASRVLLFLIDRSSERRKYLKTPIMPAYLSFDAARMEISIVKGKWW